MRANVSEKCARKTTYRAEHAAEERVPEKRADDFPSFGRTFAREQGLARLLAVLGRQHVLQNDQDKGRNHYANKERCRPTFVTNDVRITVVEERVAKFFAY